MYRARIRSSMTDGAAGQFDWFFSPDGSAWVPASNAPTMENCGELWTSFDASPDTWHREQLATRLAVFEPLSAVAD